MTVNYRWQNSVVSSFELPTRTLLSLAHRAAIVPLIPTIARVLKMEDAFGLKSMMGKGRHGLGVMAPGD